MAQIPHWYVVEFSRQQKEFHVARLMDSVEKNLFMLKRKRLCDWVPVGIFTSQNTALEYADKLRGEL